MPEAIVLQRFLVCIFFPHTRNIINEWYAKDTSKKIRAVFRAKGMSGERIASRAPYGYLTDEHNKLVVDEETAPVVRLIFQLCVDGNGPSQIARILKERKINTPGTLEFLRTGRTRRYYPDDPYGWMPQTIAHILEMKEYLGHTVNFKTTRKSFKDKRFIYNPEEKQAVFLLYIKKMHLGKRCSARGSGTYYPACGKLCL